METSFEHKNTNPAYNSLYLSGVQNSSSIGSVKS